MAKITGVISGGTPPYAFVVRKVGEATGNRCTGDCNNFPITFQEDAGNNSYYLMVTDSKGCTVDSREIAGGIGNIDCTISQPSFTAQLNQPTCNTDGSYTTATISLTNMVDCYRYKICYNSLTMDCAPCEETDGLFPLGTTNFNINLTTPSTPTSVGVLLRIYKDATCTSYKEFFDTIVTPPCAEPPTTTCNKAFDIAFTLDGSGSVSASDWDIMKSGMVEILDDLKSYLDGGLLKIGITRFNRNTPTGCATLISDLSSNYVTLKSSVQGMTQGGGNTSLSAGMDMAKSITRGSLARNNNKKIIVITDGVPNVFQDCSLSADIAGIKQEAVDLATNIKTTFYNSIYKTEIITVGVGTDADNAWLSNNIASGVDNHFAVASYSDFKNISANISQKICDDSSGNVDFAAQVEMPYCEGNVLQNAKLKLTNVVNGTRYKVCYSSTFHSSCNTNCSASDGVIAGGFADITILAPAQGASQDVTVRVYSGEGCLVYKDYSFVIVSPKCDDITLVNLDISLQPHGGDPCNNIPANTCFNMYTTLNTPTVTENGQKALVGGLLDRNVPNGNDAPNVFINAALSISCGPQAFNRFQYNITYLRSKYPSINVFNFDVFAEMKTPACTAGTGLMLIPQYNAFRGVKMTKKPPKTACDGITPATNNNTDAGRIPCSNVGNLETGILHHIFNTSIVGYRKVFSFSINLTTNTINWTTL